MDLEASQDLHPNFFKVSKLSVQTLYDFENQDRTFYDKIFEICAIPQDLPNFERSFQISFTTISRNQKFSYIQHPEDVCLRANLGNHHRHVRKLQADIGIKVCIGGDDQTKLWTKSKNDTNSTQQAPEIFGRMELFLRNFVKFEVLKKMPFIL